MKILAFDPAPKNFGVGMIEISDSNDDWDLLFVSVLENSVDALNKESFDEFFMEMSGLLKDLSPDKIVIERFMNRGRMAQAMNEKVNIMIGAILYMSRKRKIHVELTTPGAWKNKVNQIVAINDLYNASRKEIRRSLKLDYPSLQSQSKELQSKVPHTVDCCLLGLVHNTAYSQMDKATVPKKRLRETINMGVDERVARRIIDHAMSYQQRTSWGSMPE